ncbi:MAG: hypothetical protein JW812_02055 [Alphaproteobacteria bacterium]|nr:hypothetical protein [Alphaproteobacteria bacterium]MBN2780240.1 hypothetical protein [Alphaproteobacteria bacterium]
MKKLGFALLALFSLTACGEDKASCESRMEGLMTPKAACACMKKITDKYETTVDKYLNFGDKIAEEDNMDVFMKPTAEIKEFIDIGRDISINCHQHFKEKETKGDAK